MCLEIIWLSIIYCIPSLLTYYNYRVFSRDGAEVVVDDISMDFIKGSTIDFEQELIRSAFAVANNPQSETACGCGSSFALKAFSENNTAH